MIDLIIGKADIITIKSLGPIELDKINMIVFLAYSKVGIVKIEVHNIMAKIVIDLVIGLDPFKTLPTVVIGTMRIEDLLHG